MSIEIDYGVKDADRVTNSRDDVADVSEDKSFGWLASFLITKRNSLVIFVVLPSIIAAFYYFTFASDQYIAEIRLVVRTIGISERFDASEKRSGQSAIGGDSLTQDSYIVANYLESPQIVRMLETEVDLRHLFSRNTVDWWSRLPAGASFEDLYDYWLKHVDTYVDGPSGIIIFSVRAFSPEDSITILRAALDASDKMIDKISEKAKTDLVGRVETDVVANLDSYRTALDDLRNYQNKTGILDPVLSAQMTSTVISKLVEEKLKLTVSLRSLEAAKADNTANARQLRRSIQAIDDQIQLRQNSLAGAGGDGAVQLSSSMTEFARLETRRLVSQALYESAVRNLDTAKSTALKRTTFISIFSDSQLPEKSKFPNRFSQWFVFTIGLFTLWMTATLIWMSIEDHRV